MKPDDEGNAALYGNKVNKTDILNGKVPVPADATVLVKAIDQGTRKQGVSNPPVASAKNPSASP